MEELKNLLDDPLLHITGSKPRVVLRKCSHTPEEHLAMSTANPSCPGCHGNGSTWNGKYLEDCPCRTFCCKWLTETQIPVPWCVTHRSVGVLVIFDDGINTATSSTYCEYGRTGDDCDISMSVVWKTVTVSGEKKKSEGAI